MPWMVSEFAQQLGQSLGPWWREQRQARGFAGASTVLARELWGFLRDSMPDRRRQRYGDMEYDWDYRVNTTSGTVGWRERLLGIFHTAYQPTDPSAFREMMNALPIDFSAFTFVDLGSGKGRTLLIASEYPFRKIVGVELLPELHRRAVENVQAYSSPAQRCSRIESVCQDARHFELPEEPLVIFLFNPLPESALRLVIQRLEKSLTRRPRSVWIVYHNPLLESVVAASHFLERVSRAPQYSLYRTIHAAAGAGTE